MARTLTISLNEQDYQEIKSNKVLSASKIFRDGMRLMRRMPEFIDVFSIFDFYNILKKREEKIQILIREIERRNERIESLQDVLAKKELLESSQQ